MIGTYNDVGEFCEFKKFGYKDLSSNCILENPPKAQLEINQKIYNFNPNIPNTYKQYEQLTSSTGSSIMLDYYPCDQTVVRMKMIYSVYSGEMFIGNLGGGESDSFRFFRYEDTTYLDYGSGAGGNRIYGSYFASTTDVYNAEFGNRYVKDLNTGTIKFSGSTVSFNRKSYPIALFSAGDYGTSWDISICEGSTEVKHYYPVQRVSDNTCGLYEIYSQQFYTTSGLTVSGKLHFDSVATLKSGSKVCIPNGFESDGSTLKFTEITISNDTEFISAFNEQLQLIYASNGTNTLFAAAHFGETVASLPSSPTDYAVYYNYSENKCYYKDPTLGWIQSSFPIGVVTSSTSGITGIVQTFKSIGFVGSTVFTYPGVKISIPNGRTENNNIKAIQYTSNKLIRCIVSYSSSKIVLRNNGDVEENSTAEYNALQNVIINNYTTYKDRAIICESKKSNNRITELTIKDTTSIIKPYYFTSPMFIDRYSISLSDRRIVRFDPYNTAYYDDGNFTSVISIPNQSITPGGTATQPTVGIGSYTCTSCGVFNGNYTLNLTGWYTDSSLTTQFNFNTPITSNLTLYAKWEMNSGVTIYNNTANASNFKIPSFVKSCSYKIKGGGGSSGNVDAAGETVLRCCQPGSYGAEASGSLSVVKGASGTLTVGAGGTTGDGGSSIISYNGSTITALGGAGGLYNSHDFDVKSTTSSSSAPTVIISRTGDNETYSASDPSTCDTSISWFMKNNSKTKLVEGYSIKRASDGLMNWQFYFTTPKAGKSGVVSGAYENYIYDYDNYREEYLWFYLYHSTVHVELYVQNPWVEIVGINQDYNSWTRRIAERGPMYNVAVSGTYRSYDGERYTISNTGFRNIFTLPAVALTDTGYKYAGMPAAGGIVMNGAAIGRQPGNSGMAIFYLNLLFVTMTNLLSPSSFDLSDVTLTDSSTHEYRFNPNAVAMITQSLSTPIVGHKYYGCVEQKSVSGFTAPDGRFEYYYSDTTSGDMCFANWNSSTPSADWVKASSICVLNSLDSQSGWKLRSFIVSGNSYFYRRKMMIIDLTETFGAGNEPNLAWCDANIPYFTGTSTLPVPY